jgi:hypothetical protein
MFARMFVQEALNKSWKPDNVPGSKNEFPGDSEAMITSHMIHDIFGGEILKTRKKDGWHFYNRIDGERVDFTKTGEPVKKNVFEDIPSNPDEIFFDQDDYSISFMRFVRAFEETLGLEKYRPGLTA